VLVAGPRAPEQVALFLGAADLFTLPSWHEGTPNVILEALASGRRVIATDVGGIPDVINTPARGELVRARDSDGLAVALDRALQQQWLPEAASRNLVGSDESAKRLHDALLELVKTRSRVSS
jgi:glycosyltransferase involved in cell wall biosynthesis